METKNCLLGMELGAFQSFENMAVFSLHFSGNGGPEYITLGEAMERGVLVVTEVSAGGLVPELMLENKGDFAFLILDGEELAGAKQNRVLNTTILVGPKSATKIPVSCTEHGRWSYVSNVFQESGNAMSPALRGINMRGVNSSLRAGRQYRGDQSAVWDGIDRMSVAADVQSATGAMRDVFEAKRAVLEHYLKSFTLETGQKGSLIFIGGEVAGLDFVSREQAYGVLHAKLIKSYAMEAMLVGERVKVGEGAKEGDEPSIKTTYEGMLGAGGEGARKESEGKGVKSPRKRGSKAREARQAGGSDEGAKTGPDGQEKTKAREFLGKADECKETRYQSVGLGESLRYEGRDVIGSALAVDGGIIHMAFFRTSGSGRELADDMAAFSSRRRFRTA